MALPLRALWGSNKRRSPAIPAVGSSSAVSAGSGSVTDLWDQAYLGLKCDSKTKSLIEDYEKIILEDANSGGISASQLQAYYDADLSSKREQVSRVLKRKSQELEDARLVIKFGANRDVKVGEQFDRAVNCVIWAKDFVSSAVSSEPHAALAWAGVCVVLPLLLNPTKQRDAAVWAIDLATHIICRSRVIDDVYTTFAANSNLRDLKKAFEMKRIKLYAKILELEARLVCQYSDHKIIRLGKDIVRRNDWAAIVLEIDKLATLSDEDRAVLDSEKLSAGFDKMTIGFDQVTKRMSKLEEQNKAQHTAQIEWRKMDELRVQNQERSEVLYWISAVPYAEHHNFNREKRLDGTGAWLFGTERKPQFSEWRDSATSSILWLLGGIGVGKTIMVSKVVDLLLTPPNPTQFCAYFYCERGGHERSAPVDIIRSILRQVCQDSAQSGILKPVKDAYDVKKQQQFSTGKFTIEECTQLIIAISAMAPSITVVIDAIDECDSAKRWELLEFLSTISSKAVNPVKIFLSSRSDENIQNSLPGSVNLYLDIEDNRDDIEGFVREKVNSIALIRLPSLLGRPVSADLKETISKTLIAQAHGMFRWVELQFELICDGERVKREKDVYDILGELPKTLAASYAQILERIEKLPQNSLKTTKNALAWILCAKKQLTVTELLIAASVDLDGNPDQIQESDLLHYCFNLVQADHYSNCFRLAHPSVRDFLVKLPQFMEIPVNYIAAERCLGTFLSSSDQNGQANQEQQDQDDQDSFFQYSATFLTAHLEQIWTEEKDAVLEGVRFQEFFSGTRHTITSSAFDLWIQTVDKYNHHRRRGHYQLLSFVESHESPCGETRLGRGSLMFVSAYFGLLPLLHRALDNGQNIFARSSLGETAFELACQRGNLETAQLVLSQISKMNLKHEARNIIDTNHPFFNKAWVGHFRMEQWYKDEAFASQWSENDETLGNPRRVVLNYGMGAAVRSKNLQLVQWLLNEGASANAFHRAPYEGSVLQVAVESEDVRMVEVLVNAGADILFPTLDWSFRDPVDAAACKGNKKIISLLLDGQPTDVLDRALMAIAHFGHRGYSRTDPGSRYILALQIALAKKPSPDAVNEALIIAASAGSAEAAKLLINRGASLQYASSNPSTPDSERDGSVGSALRAAIIGHHQDVVKLLVVDYHALIDEMDVDRDSPTLLEEALAQGQPEIFDLLLDVGAPISPRLLGKVACANFYQHKDDPKNALFLLNLLQRRPEFVDELKNNPNCASELLLKTLNHCRSEAGDDTRGSPAVVRLLLEKGADVNYDNCSPIRIAIEKYAEDMCTLLLEQGANLYGSETRFLHTVARRREITRLKGTATANRRGRSIFRFLTADVAELLLLRGFDPWGSSSAGLPLQVAVRVCEPNFEDKDNGYNNKFLVLREWFREPRRGLQAAFTEDRLLYYKDHILKTTIWANKWNGYPVNWLHGRTESGNSILYDHEAKIVIWRESQTCHGCADVQGDEGAQFFNAPDSGERIRIGNFEPIPLEMPADGGKEWIPGYYYGGIPAIGAVGLLKTA